MKNEDVSTKNQQKKPKKKKKGKISKVYRLHQQGVSVKDIAEQMKLKESVVRAYIWRMKNRMRSIEEMGRIIRGKPCVN